MERETLEKDNSGKEYLANDNPEKKRSEKQIQWEGEIPQMQFGKG